MKNKKIIKLITAGALIFTMSNLVGCASKYIAVKPDKDPKKIVEVEDITKDLTEEKELTGGKVYIQDNMAIATMIIKEGISEKDAKALAEEYAKKIKETYKDMPVNVQAVQNGKNVANIVLEK